MIITYISSDEIYFFSTIKICSYFSFVFFIAPKKLELFKISKVMPLLCKLLLQCKKGTEEENNFFCQLLLHPVVFQNRNTKFPEVDLVAVNRNCLVSYVMVA